MWRYDPYQHTRNVSRSLLHSIHYYYQSIKKYSNDQGGLWFYFIRMNQRDESWVERRGQGSMRHYDAIEEGREIRSAHE
jgi:hypothetical protein